MWYIWNYYTKLANDWKTKIQKIIQTQDLILQIKKVITAKLNISNAFVGGSVGLKSSVSSKYQQNLSPYYFHDGLC